MARLGLRQLDDEVARLICVWKNSSSEMEHLGLGLATCTRLDLCSGLASPDLAVQ